MLAQYLLWLCVRLASVTSRYCVETTGRIELVLARTLSFTLCSSPELSLLSVLTNTLRGPSASEVTTLWRYTSPVSYTHLTLPTIYSV